MAINLEWDEKFEVGHERIDFEHRIFLGLIRELSHQVDQRAAEGRIRRTLSEIYKYADFHFLSEENIMADVHYPHLPEHREHHRRLLAELQDVIVQCGSGFGMGEAVGFLFQWFALHTSQEDKRIAEYIRAASSAPST